METSTSMLRKKRNLKGKKTPAQKASTMNDLVDAPNLPPETVPSEPPISIDLPESFPIELQEELPNAIEGELGNSAMHNPFQQTLPAFIPSFDMQRPLLLGKAFFNLINGIPFHDTTILAYSQRANRAGEIQCIVHAPLALRANSSFLEAAAPGYFNAGIFAVDLGSTAVASEASLEFYGYESDSDLEDESDDDESLSSVSVDTLSVTTENHDFPIQPGEPVFGVVTPSRLATNAAQLVSTSANPVKTVELGPQTHFTQSSDSDVARVVVQVPDGAFKTWQALLMYLYTGEIAFSPLSSQNLHEPTDNHKAACSPKSMYRLADQLDIERLKQLAESDLRAKLSDFNIVAELFSDFTWRYPSILRMQSEVFHAVKNSPLVQQGMEVMFQRIAKGELPHAGIVLTAIFHKLLG